MAGGTVGLALSCGPTPPEAVARLLIVVSALAALALAIARPARRSHATTGWLGLVALTATVAGLGTGALRLAAIDRGAFQGASGAPAEVHGYVSAVPRRSSGVVRVRVATDDGRLLVSAPEPVPDLPVGAEIEAEGTIRPPPGWQRDYLARYGIRQVLEARDVELTDGRRGGLPALIDAVRDRAEAALGRGTPEPESALLRGFVLGEDDRIEPATVEDFKRSGLAHLLAVSGENVMLLALLASPLLGLAGVPARARLVCVLALIVIYVPVTGASPSIMRAGVMGAAGVLAALASRPRSRWHAVLLAATLTLAINPRTCADPGWQLSFAAVVGILLWSAGLRDAILTALGADAAPGGIRRALAEGAAITIAATLATAPLFAHHFGAISLASLPANLLALPAVAATMWLGMLAAIVGQLPWLPPDPLTAVAGLLAAYIAQIANWLGSAGWSQASFSLPSWASVAGTYAALVGAMWAFLRWTARRRDLEPPIRPRSAPRSRRPSATTLMLGAVLALLLVGLLGPVPMDGAEPPPGLRVQVLDVGQGDAILLDPAGGAPVLVDGGPPGDELDDLLEAEGVDRLGGAILTHYQSDHAGGLKELLGVMPIHRLIYSAPARPLLAEARAAGVASEQVAEGSEVDSGALRLEVLWPSREAVAAASPDEDPNATCLVVLARWHGFDMLLTGDAEAEVAPVDPGPIDVLKVAHHGSEDAGLDGLLDRTVPRLAVISVGEDNPYGHPTLETLGTLAEHHVAVMRTDLDGTVEIDVDRQGWSASGG